MTVHRTLRAAAFAFVQHALQPLGAKRLRDRCVRLALPTEMVEGEKRVDLLLYLCRACRLQLRRGVQTRHLRRHGHLAQPQTVVERISGKRTVGPDHHHRYTHHFAERADRVRQRRRGPVKGIARLGIQHHGRVILPQRVRHVAYQHRVGREFPRRYAAERAHQPLLPDKAVRGADDLERRGIQHGRDDLQVDKARMVHEIETRLPRRELLHPDPLTLKIDGVQLRDRRQLHQRAKYHGRLPRLFVQRHRQGKKFLRRHGFDTDLHRLFPPYVRFSTV